MGKIPSVLRILIAQNFLGIGIGNHGRPWACEREGPKRSLGGIARSA